MDFINQRNSKLNIHPDGHFEFIDHISKAPSNEIEQLSKDIYRSIKMRMDNTSNKDNNQISFEKMMRQMHGQDLSNITDITKEFERKTKRNF
jgi:hypothetical protein